MLEEWLLLALMSIYSGPLVVCIGIGLELLRILGESLLLLGLTIGRNLLLSSISWRALIPLAQGMTLLIEWLEVVRAACSDVVHVGRRLRDRGRSADMLGARLYRLSG